MTNAQRKDTFLEAAANGRRLYDDERPELNKLLRSRAVTAAEREHLAVALLSEQERLSLKRFAWTDVTITLVLAVALLLAALAFIAIRWQQHTQHLAQLQSTLDRFSRLYDRYSRAYNPTADAFNSYDDRRKALISSFQSMNDIGSIAITKDKADRLRSAQLALTQSISKMKVSLPPDEQRKEAGTFSDFDTASSNSNDQLLALSATIQAGLNNPFAFAAMSGSSGGALGERLAHTMYRFKHTADALLDDVYGDTMAFKGRKNAAGAALARERKEPISRWLAKP